MSDSLDTTTITTATNALLFGSSPKSPIIFPSAFNIDDHKNDDINDSSSCIDDDDAVAERKTSSNRNERSPIRSLAMFLKELPQAVLQRKEQSIPAGCEEDPVMKLFQRLQWTENDDSEWKAYAKFDSDRCYTRNLVATDGISYTVLLLCWNVRQYSPIHDHPCDGCWMKVLQGTVHECRYQPKQPLDHCPATATATNHLVLTQETTAQQGDLVFIKDSLGLHKIGNPSPCTPAVTLHVYAPPFSTCKIWRPSYRNNGKDSADDEEDYGTTCYCSSSNSKICHYSEYGKKV